MWQETSIIWLTRPVCGVAVDGEGNILVADCWNHRVQKLTADGQFLAAVGVQGNKAAQ